MNSVRRTRGIAKVLWMIFTGKPLQRYVTAGDHSCQRLVQEARSRRPSLPSDQAILARAGYDPSPEIRSGFREYHAA